MNVVYRIEGLEFKWDENKAESNFEKHGVRFEEAAEAFLDPFYQVGDASRLGEERSFILGYSLPDYCLRFMLKEEPEHELFQHG